MARRKGFGGLLSDDQWARLLKAGRTRRFRENERIIGQDDRDTTVFLLAEGLVKVSIVGAEGVESLLAVRGPGESLGEMAALSGLPRTATVVASDGGCLTRVLSSAQFRTLTADMGLERALWEHSVLRQRESESLRAEMAAFPAGRRLAATLVRLATMLGSDIDVDPGRAGHAGPARGIMLRVGLSQKELGDAIGLSRATVASELTRLRGLGVLATGRQYVAIRDLNRLRRLAEGED